VSDGLVIVGASLAGAKAAEGARKQGWDGAIRLIGDERRRPYERPCLSKSVLLGTDDPDAAEVFPAEFYDDNRIDLLLGMRATELTLADSTVTVADGSRLRFDKLVLATGSTPRLLAFPGASLPEVHVLRTVDDSLALRAALRPGMRVATVGAGWIGTEVAAAARLRGVDVVLVDANNTPLEQALGADIGAYFARLHRSHGVELHLGTAVEAIDGVEHVRGLRLVDGSHVEADLVVVAVGATPNVGLARDAGLSVNVGVLVDRELRTEHPDVFAAGDIAEAEHPLLGGRVRIEHWSNAINQGTTAGANAAGDHEAYDHIPYVFTDQFDLSMDYSGWPVSWDDVVIRGCPDDGEFAAFYLSDGMLVGGATFNMWDVDQHVRRVIRAGLPVDAVVLCDEDVDPATWCR
jgi:3-phenylpropionate/trans-cinnamate dioxygenase ferredoxin reductase subunit